MHPLGLPDSGSHGIEALGGRGNQRGQRTLLMGSVPWSWSPRDPALQPWGLAHSRGLRLVTVQQGHHDLQACEAGKTVGEGQTSGHQETPRVWVPLFVTWEP